MIYRYIYNIFFVYFYSADFMLHFINHISEFVTITDLMQIFVGKTFSISVLHQEACRFIFW